MIQEIVDNSTYSVMIYTKHAKIRQQQRAISTDVIKIIKSLGERENGPGGRMQQKIYRDPFNINDWDLDNYSRCFIHLTNSLLWEHITGEKPNHPPVTARKYNEYGLPWFDYYDEGSIAIDESKKLAKLKSITELFNFRQASPLPENESVIPKNIVRMIKSSGKNIVREGSF